MPAKSSVFFWIALVRPWLLAALLAGAAPVRGADPDLYARPVLHPAIPLLDEAGRHVLQSGQPYSPRMSCGNGNGAGCHDYKKITKAYHFQQGRDEAGDEFGWKRGLSQLVSPGYFGGYNCMGASNPAWLARKANGNAPEFGDLGAADAVKECGQCHAGGGWGEVDRNGVRYDRKPPDSIAALDGDYFSRTAAGPVRWDWPKSGVREADCLHCHADFTSLAKPPSSGLGANDGRDGSDPALAHYRRLKDDKLLAAGHFRQAASALLEFLNVRPDQPGGLALLSFQRAIVPGTVQPDYSLVSDGAGNPILRWNPAAFDANGKAHIPMRRFPGSDNCMACHETGNARRGFYGFGEEARETRDALGIVQADFRDDVHKGKVWTEDNGEVRTIDDCNACHAKGYYTPAWANVKLDADHHFPKGNGDNDVRNDLDGMPPVTSCEHCHDTALKPALPSGQKNAVDAHLVIWQSKGDMAGYSPDSLRRITRTHLDVVACQTCHINKLAGPDGAPLAIHYRYRRGDGGKAKVFPYLPAYRYFAKDKTSGRVLYRWERNAVAASEPTTYEGWKALKQAYDRLLRDKGYTNPDVRFVYVSSNDYVISHNTRPSTQATQCADCHARKQGGAFSSLLADSGLLGAGRAYPVAQLPDRRLVDEGIVELGNPAFKVDGSGLVSERLTDVLYASRIETSMTVLKADSARAIGGEFKAAPADEAVGYAGLPGDAGARLMGRLNSGDWLLFNSGLGHESLRGFALILAGNLVNNGTLEDARVEVESRPVQSKDGKRIRKLQAGKPVSDIYTLALLDAGRAKLKDIPAGDAMVKLPYSGAARKAKQVRAVWSADGQRWRKLPLKDLVEFKAAESGKPGHVVLRTRRIYPFIALAGKAKKK